MSNELDAVITTWFVSDDPEHASFFPQIGGSSETTEAKAIYWRCILCFFASSIAVNPRNTHVLFTNSKLPIVDGVDVAQAFDQWQVRVVYLPISYRLPRGRVEAWGNQFYIFDIIKYLAEFCENECYLVLDSDCVWVRPVTELAKAIGQHGVLTYLIDDREHPEAEPINGLSRQGMARFLGSVGGKPRDSIPYCGGEIFAATRDETKRLAGQIDRVWAHVLADEKDTPKEEAHLLSILYAMNEYEVGTANSFIKRIWTTFKRNNVEASDVDLTIWHLPSEKMFGFRRLFRKLVTGRHNYRDPAALGFRPDVYGLTMGLPRRSASKLVRDISAKLLQRLYSLDTTKRLRAGVSIWNKSGTSR
ncbi:hypothetical protein [Bradyrhizobium canariense]|uniref:Nucleotide-diphospho-sugar transferase domain-containing protein n=1 Tax=Bradyrhizobium canariense TaxID=255045 RepID=A0A1H2BN68_9BRAD|nr:hypothetical protein [Bradyrhizobium canariense]SDT59564.1 hypothetical protein SAMN05444158_7356 [Bradyrhizobium canariense]